MIVYDSGGRPVKLGDSIGRGGEATVYRLRDEPGWLAKIYEPAPRPNYPDKLSWMLAHPPQNPTQAAGHPSLAWPAGLLFDARRRLAGFRLPHIRDAVPVLVVFNPRRRAETLPQFDRRYLHRTARNLAAALGALQRSGYVAGDLNESNVLVTVSALVTLIDTDSFQVQEQRNGRSITHRCPVAKLEYTPPELQGKPVSEVIRRPEHDAFGLGVLIFQLLMQGSHPFRSQWLGEGEPPPVEARIAQGGFPYTASPPCPVVPPKNAPSLDLLHPSLSELVRRCFVDGHRKPILRPSPEQWERAIAEAESSLTLCPSAHFYSNHLRACPYCPPLPRTVRRRSGPVRPARRDDPVPPAHRPSSAAPSSSRPAPAAPANPAPVGATAGAAASAPAAAGAPTAGFPFLQQQPGLWGWVRPRVYKSFAVGGGVGALAGALPGAVVGAAFGPGENTLAWGLVWALGGAAAGMARGWLPWYRISLWVSQRIGWNRFWQGIGLLLGAVGGALAGLVIGWWAIFPIFFGIFWGAKFGRSLGRRIWQAGNRLGWERIWAVAGAGGAALIGWTVAGWASASGLADGFGSSLAAWISSHSASLTLVWTVLGATGGALGGAIAGTCADLFGRLSGLVD